VLLFLSLSLVVGLSRQLSLVHAAFVTFGATTLGHLLQAGVPYPMALVGAGLLIVPLGAAMAIPAIRLSGLHLALATFAFGILAQNLLFPTAMVFGPDGFTAISRPSFLSGDIAFFYFVLAVVVVGAGAIELTRATRIGRVLTGLADSPTAVESLGISGVTPRVVVFCLSAFFAAVAGGLLGTLVQSVGSQSFHAYSSLLWVAVLVAAGVATFGGSVLAAVLFIAVPSVVEWSAITEWQPVFYGVAAILLAQTDNGLMGVVRNLDFASWATATRWRLGSERAAERLVRTTPRPSLKLSEGHQ
jgi:ABC-type branched-subunit amino acid transport system permease subunit